MHGSPLPRLLLLLRKLFESMMRTAADVLTSCACSLCAGICSARLPPPAPAPQLLALLTAALLTDEQEASEGSYEETAPPTLWGPPEGALEDGGVHAAAPMGSGALAAAGCMWLGGSWRAGAHAMAQVRGPAALAAGCCAPCISQPLVPEGSCWRTARTTPGEAGGEGPAVLRGGLRGEYVFAGFEREGGACCA